VIAFLTGCSPDLRSDNRDRTLAEALALVERPIGYRDGRVDRDISMGGEENRRHRLLTHPLAADIHYRRETSGGTDHFDEHRKRRIADQILFVPGPLDGNGIADRTTAPSSEEPKVC